MQVVVEKLDHFGRGITYIDNKICFIKNALPGELVEIIVTNRTKKYLEASVEKFLKVSSDRKKVECPFYESCGGCHLSHLEFSFENNFKEEKVKEIMKKFAGVLNDKIQEIEYTEEYFYRNKITLHGQNGKLGYYKNGTRDIVSINRCLLVDRKVNDLLHIIEKTSLELNKVIVRISNDGRSLMLGLEGNVKNYQELLDNVSVLMINGSVATGQNKLLSAIGSKNYFLSVNSFFQVNKTLTEKLYNDIRMIVQNETLSKVMDLYCGVGTIGLYINDLVDEVIGVDVSLDNILDAFKNKELNSASNVNFICDKVENIISTFKNDIDLIIVDPPRAGLDKNTKKNICRIQPKRLIYVSCDPVTLARDIRDLSFDYQVGSIKPYNMFPRTYHVECVCVLNRR